MINFLFEWQWASLESKIRYRNHFSRSYWGSNEYYKVTHKTPFDIIVKITSLKTQDGWLNLKMQIGMASLKRCILLALTKVFMSCRKLAWIFLVKCAAEMFHMVCVVSTSNGVTKPGCFGRWKCVVIFFSWYENKQIIYDLTSFQIFFSG